MENNTKDLVSVIIPSYNAGDYLKQSVYSIINQTYKNLEIIIVDDGSTDNSIDSIIDITDERIIIISQKNQGKSVAVNNALDRINGAFWLIQDADDLSYPNRIENQVNVLKEKRDIAAVYVGHDLLVDTKIIAPVFREKTTIECKHDIEAFRMPTHDATGMYRSKMVEGMRYDPKLKIGEGLDFILRLGEKLPLYVYNKCLYTYRINFNSLIRKNPDDNIEWIKKAIKKAFKRRNIPYNDSDLFSTIEYKKHKRAVHNHIIPHCMESVICLKDVNQLYKAITVGVNCIKLQSSDPYFYKPLVYALIPNFLIRLYRLLKMKIDQKKRIIGTG